MRVRLRPAPNEVEMVTLYSVPHDHHRFPDHQARVNATIDMAREMLVEGGYVVDLSCGNAVVGRALAESHGARLALGDFAAGYEFQGPIEQTAMAIVEPVDLWVLGETLEHLDDPERVLHLIRERARALVLSTPVLGEDGSNREHIWAWDAVSVGELLEATGWKVLQHVVVPGPYYYFGLWGCE